MKTSAWLGAVAAVAAGVVAVEESRIAGLRQRLAGSPPGAPSTIDTPAVGTSTPAETGPKRVMDQRKPTRSGRTPAAGAAAGEPGESMGKEDTACWIQKT
jgi:hypothetical protein